MIGALPTARYYKVLALFKQFFYTIVVYFQEDTVKACKGAQVGGLFGKIYAMKSKCMSVLFTRIYDFVELASEVKRFRVIRKDALTVR